MGVFSRRAARPPVAEARLRVPSVAALPMGPSSFATVDVTSGETALQSVAVRSAVDLVCSLGSELPIDVYRGKGTDRKHLNTPAYLLDPAGDGHGLQDWAYQVLESWLLRGNVFGEVLDRSSQGFPTQVSLQHPDEVSGYIDSDGTVRWLIAGRPVDLDRLLHRRVNAVPGRVLGMSVISAHAEQIGLSITTTRFGLQWFQDGAHPGGILTNEEDELAGEAQVRAIKDRFLAALRGSREPVVMGRGWKYQSVQVAPEESQFLETQGWTAAECARIFGPGVAEVLGYGSSGVGGGSLTYTNRVDRSADLLQFALNKWLRRLERLLGEMLPAPQYVRIDRDALLEMTTLDRYRAYSIALQSGFRTIDEVREDEDMRPVPWGKKPFAIAPQGQDNGEPADTQEGA